MCLLFCFKSKPTQPHHITRNLRLFTTILAYHQHYHRSSNFSSTAVGSLSLLCALFTFSCARNVRLIVRNHFISKTFACNPFDCENTVLQLSIEERTNDNKKKNDRFRFKKLKFFLKKINFQVNFIILIWHGILIDFMKMWDNQVDS